MNLTTAEIYTQSADDERTQMKRIADAAKAVAATEQKEVDDFTHEQSGLKVLEVSAWDFAKHPILSSQFLYHLYKVLQMKSYKTTIAGAIAAAAILCRIFGLEIPQPVLDGISAAALFFVGLFAKDSNVTGGDVQQ